MPKLADLLWTDEQFAHANALSQCFGDRYLFARNKIFTNIRNAFLDLGFQFVAGDTDLWRDYAVAPLFCLQRILDDKSVPIADTTSTLKRIVRQNKGMTVPWPRLLELVKRNFALHESSHCVAHNVLTSRECLKVTATLSAGERVVLDAMNAEAFASTVERLAWTFCDSDIHRMFFYANSFVDYSTSPELSLNDAVDSYGLDKIFRLAFLCYFYGNCQAVQPDRPAIDSFIDVVFGDLNMNRSHRSALHSVMAKFFQVSTEFVDSTSPLYFRLLGVEEEFVQFKRYKLDPNQIEELGLLDAMSKLSPFLMSGYAATSDRDGFAGADIANQDREGGRALTS